MASINIGSLKFNWKGTYNGSTAYAVDDVTEYNGSSYICILASTGNLPTNTTYFQPMATGGTDLSTTLTTQGDIVYRDGSGLQRLAKPASDKFLQNTSGGILSWADAGGGKVLQAVQNSVTGNSFTTTSSTFTYVSGMPSVDITPSATSSKVLILFNGGASETNGGNGVVSIFRDSTNLGNTSNGFWKFQHHANYREPGAHGVYLDSPNTTSQITYQLRILNQSNGSNMTIGESCRISIICLEIGV